ncbi:hypothetical protein [Ileibacterium valens]|uniref:hypothetical protein n=1 Tax=Ileibacterium valens TaxID=1862668 RepID=UPI002573D9E3|nr:hypothetical protein [Ileibacterium valens]
MHGFNEISFVGKPTSKQKIIRITLWTAAFGCLVCSILFWPLLLAAMILFAAAYFYSVKLDYEYEYIFSDRDLSIDRIIQKAKRKTMVLVPFAEIEEIRVLNNPKEMTGGMLCCNEEDPKIELICHGKQGKRSYLILDCENCRKALFYAMPKKAVGLKYNR